MKTIIISLIIAIVSIFVISCATLFTGTKDNITINSDPEGAKIMIDGIDYGRTPATVSVTRPGFGDKQVTLQLEGYETRTFTLQKEFNTIAILNLGSILGWAVDIASGSVTRYSPKHYEMELRQKTQSLKFDDLKTNEYGYYMIESESDVLIVEDEANGVSIIFLKNSV